MKKTRYSSMAPFLGIGRRDFLKTLGTAAAAISGGIVLGIPSSGEDKPFLRSPQPKLKRISPSS